MEASMTNCRSKVGAVLFNRCHEDAEKTRFVGEIA